MIPATLLTGVFLVVLLQGGLIVWAEIPDENSAQPDSSQRVPDDLDRARSILETMTLDQKIGQLLIVGFTGTTVNRDVQKIITSYQIGGFNLLGRNIRNHAQARALIDGMKTLAARSQPLPVFLATDQEGGVVTRFRFLKELTSQRRIKHVQEAEQVARRRGMELQELGVNMVFSPVLDYVDDPQAYLRSRTFRGAPEDVASLGRAMIEGYQAAGVIAVPKHFPGYGNITRDPHTKRVILPSSQEAYQWSLGVFGEVIRTTNTVALMVAHIIVPSIDSLPATLSPKITKDILRQELGYSSLVMTDDLEMASVSYGRRLGAVAVQALLAGNDVLIGPYTVVGAIRGAVEDGVLPETELNEKVLRVIRVKLAYLY
jgi:beta-N-acetylhexosaminidase